MKMGTYRSRNGTDVYRVIMGDDRGVVLENKRGNRNWWSNDGLTQYFVEHKEPRTLTFFVNIYETDGAVTTGVVWETREEAIAAKTPGVIDTMEITWTEKSDG